MSSPESSRMQLLLHAPIPGMLARVAAPNIAATLMMTASTFADAYFVGQLGTTGLAALALVFPFQTLMIMMSGGAIGGGVTSAVSRALGRTDKTAADAAAWHAIVINVVMALLFAVALGLFARPVFALLGGTGEALEDAVLYARIAFGGGLAVWSVWILGAILRGTGDADTPARAILVTGCIQIALSGALTLGWFGFPALGIAGPPTALVLCHAVAALYMLYVLLSGRAAVSIKSARLQAPVLVDILRVGGIGLIHSIAIALTVIVVTGFVGRYGTEALAGYGLGSRLELMLVPITFGIGGALTMGVGANFGAGQYARARRIAWTGGGASAVIIGLFGLVVALIPSLWLDLFTADPKAREYGSLYLRTAAPLYFLFALGQTLYFASQGTGRVGWPVAVSVLRLLTVSALGTLAVTLMWSAQALFVAVAAGFAVVGIGLALCMRTRAWRPDFH